LEQGQQVAGAGGGWGQGTACEAARGGVWRCGSPSRAADSHGRCSAHHLLRVKQLPAVLARKLHRHRGRERRQRWQAHGLRCAPLLSATCIASFRSLGWSTAVAAAGQSCCMLSRTRNTCQLLQLLSPGGRASLRSRPALRTRWMYSTCTDAVLVLQRVPSASANVCSEQLRRCEGRTSGHSCRQHCCRSSNCAALVCQCLMSTRREASATSSPRLASCCLTPPCYPLDSCRHFSYCPDERTPMRRYTLNGEQQNVMSSRSSAWFSAVWIAVVKCALRLSCLLFCTKRFRRRCLIDV
jgi:hypothetical protein